MRELENKQTQSHSSERGKKAQRKQSPKLTIMGDREGAKTKFENENTNSFFVG